MDKYIIIIGTLDTKGKEIKYLADRIKYLGSNNNLNTIIVDIGILGEAIGITPDITSEEVSLAGGYSLNQLRDSGRGRALEMMTKGAIQVIKKLYLEKKCDGIVSLAGGSGSSVVCEAMEALPIGIPKLIATPLASGSRLFEYYIKNKDIMIMHSVIDILGVNSISKSIYDNIASSIVGQVINRQFYNKSDKAVAITMIGNTTKGVSFIKYILESHGFEVVIFHASGVGGRAMEEMIKDNFFKGVIDYTTCEIFEDIIGGLQRGAGPDRMTVAGKLGIPQIIVPGCIDFFDQGPIDSIPEQFKNRKLYMHSPVFTLCRLTKEEMANLGVIFADKLNQSIGKTIVVIPLKGFSIPDCPGGFFEDKEADMAFIENLERNLHSNIRVQEINAHINDKIFAENVANIFIDLFNEGFIKKD
jgi:uncharacterized protein (UPF0261 family)